MKPEQIETLIRHVFKEDNIKASPEAINDVILLTIRLIETKNIEIRNMQRHHKDQLKETAKKYRIIGEKNKKSI